MRITLDRDDDDAYSDDLERCPECGAPLCDPFGCDVCPWQAGPAPAEPINHAWRTCAGPADGCSGTKEAWRVAATDPCPSCSGPTTPVLGFLTREPYQLGEESKDTFFVRNKAVPAEPAHDVCIPIREAEHGRMIYPRCPECGGAVVWAEAGGVPGSRKCIGTAADIWESRRWRDTLDMAALNGEAPSELPGKPGCGSTFAESSYHAASRSHRCARHAKGIR